MKSATAKQRYPGKLRIETDDFVAKTDTVRTGFIVTRHKRFLGGLVTTIFSLVPFLKCSHTHRRHLAQQWWSFERAKASVRPDDNDDYVPQAGSEWTTLADHIIDTFKCIAIDTNKDMRMMPRARG
jgi:hypothetical protein